MDGMYFMKVDEFVRPVVHLHRNVYVSLRNRTRLKEELDNSVKESIITSVTEPTKWVSSMVRSQQESV